MLEDKMQVMRCEWCGREFETDDEVQAHWDEVRHWEEDDA